MPPLVRAPSTVGRELAGADAPPLHARRWRQRLRPLLTGALIAAGGAQVASAQARVGCEDSAAWGGAAPLVDLEVDDGAACDAPWLQVGDVGLWSSVLPLYRQRFGWSLRWGLLAADSRGRELTLVAAYSEREHRLYPSWSLRAPLWHTTGGRCVVRSSGGYRDGRREFGLLLHGALEPHDSERPEASAYLGFGYLEYVALRDLGPRLWSTGRVARLLVGLAWHPEALPGLLSELAGGIDFQHGLALAGSDYRYQRITLRGSVVLSRCLLWGRAGVQSGTPPAQSALDLAESGQLLSVPLGAVRGRRFWAAGLEHRIGVRAALHAASFAALGGVPGLRTALAEAGVGIGLAERSGRSTLWRVRLDWPVYSSGGLHHGDRWDLRRVALRIWLWPGSLAAPDAPDCDYRYP